MNNFLWSGRFKNEIDESFLEFSKSDDYRLWEEDIEGNIIQAKVLNQSGILSNQELKQIISALSSINEDIKKNGIQKLKKFEDIHSAIENLLIDQAGKCGEKIHTGRSRNDQISLDLRLFVIKKSDEIIFLLKKLKIEFENSKIKYKDYILPGFTHLQHAQPVKLAKYLDIYIQMIMRDISGFENCKNISGYMPLGSGAINGTTVKINRKYYLNFSNIKKLTENSMDTVSDRDFLIEFVFRCTVFLVHFSRFAEDMVLWSTTEFGFLRLPDEFSTGSSMMPQKKNPDVFELIRGKSARGISSLTGVLTVFKSLPQTYDRDMQEDKYYLFQSYDTVKDILIILIKLISKLEFIKEKMKASADDGFIIATQICEKLVNYGINFREAHRITGNLVKLAILQNKNLYDLTVEEKKKINDKIIWDKIEFPKIK